MSGAFDRVAAAVTPSDAAAAATATERLSRLAKPVGALGRLEDLAVQLAAVAGRCPPPRPRPAAVAVFAGDHGVHAEGVTPWPQAVTAAMLRTILGGRAAVNVLAAQAGATVTVVDVGVAADLEPAPGLVVQKVVRGTRNLAREPALSSDEVTAALDAGADAAVRLVGAGARCLVTGEMGIGNTTPAAAVVAALTGRPPGEVTGRGTGIDDAALGRKVEAVTRGLARLGERAGDPLTALAEVGGAEIAAIAGFVTAGAAARVPVVIDGLIAGAGLLAAARLAPDIVGYCVAAHRSTEPGSAVVLESLGLVPVLDLGMRLGEATGACLALPIVDAAARVLAEMATLDEVTGD